MLFVRQPFADDFDEEDDDLGLGNRGLRKPQGEESTQEEREESQPTAATPTEPVKAEPSREEEKPGE